MSDGYNGWSNWETWNVALWFDNDETMYLDRRHTGRDGTWTDLGVRDYVTAYLPNGTPDMDDTDGGYSAVDWREIADAWNEE